MTEEIEVAEGKISFTHREETLQFFNKLNIVGDVYQQSLRQAFERASEKSAVGPWDQKEFERLLVEWLVASDQPFQEVERPQFRSLLEYVRHRAEELDVPSSSTMQRRVMDMGQHLQQGRLILPWIIQGSSINPSLDYPRP
ncbi:hypothetical protein K438DRAFT_1768768 [Mycena galopus ATCC 62051]|nr:hypothetical protein K438DRAFT_1768768 [Mycena galopus ATCC 62051]